MKKLESIKLLLYEFGLRNENIYKGDDIDILVDNTAEKIVKLFSIPIVSNRKPIKYKCLLCGRDKFTRKTPHRCNNNFRKRNIKWQPIYY